MGAALRSEWTKLRTVPGWLLALLLSAGAIIGIGLLPGMGGSCGTRGPGSECLPTTGPDGTEVADAFMFSHGPLTGDGRLTVRVASLTGVMEDVDGPRSYLAPWAKAGLMIKASATPGAAYAAVMLTGGHGVRLQSDFVHDVAGSATTGAPRWLRLTRAGDDITAEESADGTQWTVVGTARLAGLPSTVEAGLFVTSPQYAEAAGGPFGASGASGGPTLATADFDHLSPTPTGWHSDRIGGSPNGPPTAAEPTADGFRITGTGDIAPAVSGAAGIGTSLTETLIGTFAGLILVVVVATMFVTAEYRRGLIRTTVTATPARARVLVAKAVVLGAVAFVCGVVAAAVVLTLGPGILRGNGAYVHPSTLDIQLRMALGTGALLAVAAVLALALGALIRRSAAAVTIAVVVIVLPYLLAMSVLPAAAGQWLLRVTPAAAFALQQSAVQYAQVDNLYTPMNGYFPLAPWAGFAVLAGWAALAFGLAVVRLRRRDV